VIGRHLVEKCGLYKLKARLKKLGSDDERQCTANEKHGEAEPEVQRTYVFMISRIQPSEDPFLRTVIVIVVVTCVYNFAHGNPYNPPLTSALSGFKFTEDGCVALAAICWFEFSAAFLASSV
tara:strand:- start:126 stop:491 length:366 start_codon:yes stop_codon:yes gene_type:complete